MSRPIPERIAHAPAPSQTEEKRINPHAVPLSQARLDALDKAAAERYRIWDEARKARKAEKLAAGRRKRPKPLRCYVVENITALQCQVLDLIDMWGEATVAQVGDYVEADQNALMARMRKRKLLERKRSNAERFSHLYVVSEEGQRVLAMWRASPLYEPVE